jgi:hypothetical protein
MSRCSSLIQLLGKSVGGANSCVSASHCSAYRESFFIPACSRTRGSSRHIITTPQDLMLSTFLCRWVASSCPMTTLSLPDSWLHHLGEFPSLQHDAHINGAASALCYCRKCFLSLYPYFVRRHRSSTSVRRGRVWQGFQGLWLGWIFIPEFISVFYESFDVHLLDSSFSFLEWYDENDLISRTWQWYHALVPTLIVPCFVNSVKGRYTEAYPKKYDQELGLNYTQKGKGDWSLLHADCVECAMNDALILLRAHEAPSTKTCQDSRWWKGQDETAGRGRQWLSR